MPRILVCIFLCLMPFSAFGDEREDAFVEANVLSILYHELGHALIDVMQLPVFGQEEDAADVLSAIMIHETFEEEEAVAIAYNAAQGFLADAEELISAGEEPAYWDVHGPDLQRYYTFACLLYGANPDEREDVAAELGLPEDRAVTCEDEYQLAIDSWGSVLDEVAQDAPGTSLSYGGVQETLFEQVIRAEVAELNRFLVLPVPVVIKVEDCGEVNAYYHPELREITMCSEFEGHLRKMVTND